MDALEQAIREMERVEIVCEDYPGMLKSSLAIAQAYAAIAHAEQLKRIADILEHFIGEATATDWQEMNGTQNSQDSYSDAVYKARLGE